MAKVLIGLLAVLAASWAHAQAITPIAGTDYVILDTPQPTSTGDKIEVVEVFSYACNHCNDFVPYIDAWKKRQPKDVALVYSPAVFGNPTWEAWARAFYVGEVLGVPLSKTHDAIFKRNFRDGKPPLVSLDEIGLFFQQSFAVDAAKFNQTAMSFAVETKVRRADDMSRRYRVAGTPTMVVGGKYVVNVTASGLQGVINTVDYLVAKERAARKAAPAKKAA
jgi:protein dithiol oxidoreductase (disulfide-forming)